MASAPEVPTSQPTAAVVGGSETILVAEDDVAVRAWVCRSLGQLGYTVIEARDGAEAVRLTGAADGTVALVLADVVMGGMGGVELRNRLAEAAPSVPVLLMSAHAPDELLTRRVVNRDDQVLQKPFDISDLAQRIRGLLDACTAAPS